MNDTSVITIEPETKASTSTALTVLKTSIPALIAADKDDLLSKLKAEIDGFEPDTSTKKGRELIASMAMKPRRVKAAYGRIADSLKEGAQATIKTVNAENKQMAELLDQLAVDLRRPLDEIEAFEAAREKANKDNIAAIEALADGLSTLTADEIKVRYRSLSALVEFSWSIEFTARAQRVRDGVVAQLEVAHQAAKQREEAAARAEAERLAEIERQRVDGHRAALVVIRQFAVIAQPEPTSTDLKLQIDRLDRLPSRDWQEFLGEAATLVTEVRAGLSARMAVAEAAEAAAKAAHDAKIAADAAETAKKAAEAAAALALEKSQRETQEAQEKAQRLANDAEAARVKGHRDALGAILLVPVATSDLSVREIDDRLERVEILHQREWEEFADEAQRTADDVCKTLVGKRVDAVEREAAEAEVAAEAQRQRDRQTQASADQRAAKKIADDQVEADRLAAARAKNVAHRKQINGEVLADLMVALRLVAPLVAGGEEGPMELIAKAVIVAVAKNEIRHVTIGY